MSNFRVGQKVVCVRSWENLYGHKNISGPLEGEIYTIREIGFIHPDRPDILTVRLAEIVNSELDSEEYGKWEPSFAAYRFRPLVERKTDISCFTKLLKTKSLEELAQ